MEHNQDKKKCIWTLLTVEEIAQVEKAAALERRSRSSFLGRAVMNAANKTIQGEE